MADQTDVADALVNIISQAVYPDGTSQPSVSGAGIKIYQGWPVATQLQLDLPKGIVHISVYPKPQERITSAMSRDWRELSVNEPTLTTTVDGNTLTIAGTVAANQTIAAIINGDDVVYTITPTDTLETIAAGVAALINATHSTSIIGSTITIPDAYRILARVGVMGVSIRELGRQAKVFQITVWASCFDKREPVARVVGKTLRKLVRIDLPDGTQGNIFYKSSVQDDNSQLQGIYRRDFMYEVDYAETETSDDYAVTLAKSSVSNGLTLQNQSTPITTVK